MRNELYSRKFPVAHWMLVSFFVLLFCFLAMLITGGPIYETSDDVGQSLVAAGVGTVTRPEDHILFSHFLIGRILNQLYSCWPATPWYGIYLLTALLAGNVIAAVCLTFRKKTAIATATLFIATAGAILRPTLLMQFTTTAAMVATAASLLMIWGFERQRVTTLFLRCLLASSLLFVVAAMIRPESAILIAAISTVVLTIRIISTARWHQVRCAVACIAVMGGTILITNFVNVSYYNSNGWNDFYPLYKLRFELLNCRRIYNIDPRTLNAFESVGWQPEDVDLFFHWYDLDQERFGLESLRIVNRLAPKINPSFPPWYVLDELKMLLKDASVLPFLVLLGFLSAAITSVRFPRRCRILFLAALVSLFVYLLVAKYLPPRIYASVLSYSVLLLLLYSTETLSRFARSVQGYKLVTASLIGAFLATAPLVSEVGASVARTNQRNELLAEAVNGINPRTDDLYVAWAGAFPWTAIKPFDNLQVFFRNWNLVEVARNPYVLARLKQWNINDLICQLDKKNVYLISSEEINNTIGRYVAYHYKKTAVFQNCYNQPGLPLEIYRVSYTTKSDNKTKLPGETRRLGPTDLTLFPLESQLGQWGLSDMKASGALNGSYENIGGLPCMGLNTASMDLLAEQFSHLTIELAVNPWIRDTRSTYVQLYLNNKGDEFKSFFLPLSSKGQLQSYSHSLPDLDFKPGDRITHINIFPLYTRKSPQGETVTIKRIGLIRNTSTRMNQDSN